MSDILTTILARKADEIAERSARVSLADLRARVADASPTRGFADALNAMIAQGDPAVVAEVLSRGGFDPQQLLALASDPQVKDALKATTEEAVRRGVFGAPSLFVGDELFFGQDRLDFVREALLAR